MPSSTRLSTVLAVTGAICAASACGHQSQEAPAVSVEASSKSTALASPTHSGSASASASPSTFPSTSAKPSGNTSSKIPSAGSRTTAASSFEAGQKAPQPAETNFPIPVSAGNSTQIITVKASYSYATVTAWTKESSGWKPVITANGRVGSNGVVAGAIRKQGTYTTPSGTYTITEGFGLKASDTKMPYTRVNSTHWWVQDPESKFYNSMHTAAGADFPLTESGERGSEHLINYPTQYAKALVINFNRWPATPGRGAGIFLHVNGRGATAGCVSVPRATMDQIMSWIKPSAHPRIAIG